MALTSCLEDINIADMTFFLFTLRFSHAAVFYRSSSIQRSSSMFTVLREAISIVVLDESALFELIEGNLQLFLRIHDDWAIPCDRFANWVARDQKEADR